MDFGRKDIENSAQSGLSQEEVIDRLNQALAIELHGVMGHLRRRHGLRGRRQVANDPSVRSAELIQQDHALALAARITELGGEPILSPVDLPDPAGVGDSRPEQSLRRELIDNSDAAKAYRVLLRDLGNSDPVTSAMIERICASKELRMSELTKALG